VKRLIKKRSRRESMKKYILNAAAVLSLAALFTGCSSMLDVPGTAHAAGVGISTSTEGYSVNENGTLNISIILQRRPSANVTIPVSLVNNTGIPNLASISVSSLVFTNSNWNTPQIITVTAPDNHIREGNQIVSLNFGLATSTDPAYSGLTISSVPITVVDIDDPGVAVSPTAGLITTKTGGTATFTVVLGCEPVDSITGLPCTVTIPVASSNTSEGTVSTSSLTFNSSNYNIPQTVTITGVNDGNAEGNVPYSINLGPCATADSLGITITTSDYSAMTVSSVSVTNTDNSPSLVVTPNESSTSATIQIVEGGTPNNGTFTVYLSSAPLSNITYTVTSSDPSHATVSPSTLTFTTSNYTTPQTVTVTAGTPGNNNANVDIVVGPSSANKANMVAFSVLDSLSPNFIVSNLSNPTNTSGATATFTVHLTTSPSSTVYIPVNANWDSKNSSGQQGVISPASGTTFYSSTGGTYTSGTPYLQFNAANYSTNQTITVTGQDDYIYNGNVQYYIQVGGPSTSDTSYAALSSQYVTVNNLEERSPGFAVSKTSGMATDTQGNLGSNYATFTICLKSKPVSNVVLNLTCSTGYGTISPASLTFTAANWNAPQTVNVTGNSNGVGHSGNYTVATSISTSDPTYSSSSLVTAPSFSIYNCDDTSFGIAVCWLSGASTNTSESGGSMTFYLIPKQSPSSSVTVPVSSDNTTSGGTVTTTTPVTLTSANYNTLSSTNAVTVKGAYNGDFTDDVTYHIGFGTPSDSSTIVSQITVVNTHISLLTVSGVTSSSDQGGIGSFTVKMNVQPSNDVTFTVSPSSSYATGVSLTNSSASMSGSVSLTFTNSSYNTAQTVYIQGDTYNGVRGDKTSTVSFGALSSGDTGMNGYTPPAANAVTCKEANKLIWVTGLLYDGNFNGFSTIDQESLASANDPNRPSSSLISGATYKALITDGVNRIATTSGTDKKGQTADWVLQPSTTYYLYTGSAPYTTPVLTTDSNGLFNSLTNPFSSSSSDQFWTGLNPNLTTAVNTCGGWSSDSGLGGQYGIGGVCDSTAWSSSFSAHNIKKKLIFVQQ
jgi:hypothetical protein